MLTRNQQASSWKRSLRVVATVVMLISLVAILLLIGGDVGGFLAMYLSFAVGEIMGKDVIQMYGPAGLGVLTWFLWGSAIGALAGIFVGVRVSLRILRG
jgi:hypothetical protein